MRIVIVFFLVITFFIGYKSEAQPHKGLSTDSRRAAKLYKKAEEYSSKRQIKKTLKYLKKAIDKDERFVEAYSKAAIYSQMMKNDKQAKAYFLKVINIKPNDQVSKNAFYNLADYYLGDGVYDSCLLCVKKGIKFFRKGSQKYEDMEKWRKTCKFGIEAKKNPVDVDPQPLSDTVNKLSFQYYPTLTADNQYLVFTAKDGEKFNNIHRDENIYVSVRDNGHWDIPRSISRNINTNRYNEGTCSISGDGKVLVLTICGRPDSYGSCDLYISYKEAGSWSEPANMGKKVNSSGWDSQPSLSPDGKTVYFASRRKGGYGKTDIWKCHADKYGNWKEAENLGPEINTAGEEVSPFIHPSMSTLYFASKAHLGMGSFDIFVAYKDSNNTWSEPENLGYPINTHKDESTLFITADGSKGYYSSEVRKNHHTERFIIYKMDIPEEISCKNTSTYAKGIVTDANTNEKIQAEIELIDINTNETVSFVESDPENGDYLVVLTEGKEYALYVSKQGYLFKSISFDYKNPDNFDPVNLNVALKPIKAGRSVTLNNLFFETDEYKLSPKSKTELDKLINFMYNNPEIEVEVSGHTDNVGSKAYNKELSKKRAKSVFDYMIENNIDPGRVSYKGYGETEPAVSNETAEKRKKNRRIEFKIL